MRCTVSVFFFVKEKTAYEMRISDWSSDVCSSDLQVAGIMLPATEHAPVHIADVITAIGKLRKTKLDTGAIAAALGYDELEIKRLEALAAGPPDVQHGSTSCRERVCMYVSISVVAGSLKKKIQYDIPYKQYL